MIGESSIASRCVLWCHAWRHTMLTNFHGVVGLLEPTHSQRPWCMD